MSAARDEHEQIQEALREEQTDSRGDGREKKAFQEELADETQPTRPEGNTHRDFFRARCRPRHHHVGDVGASNEKHEPHRGEHDRDEASVVLVEQRFRDGLYSERPAAMRVRIDFRELRRDRRGFIARPVKRDLGVDANA